MKVLLTGASGFLGWHARTRLVCMGGHDVVPVTRANWSKLGELATGADAIVHVAGVNRGPDGLVRQGNVELAQDVASALTATTHRPVVVFANSIQAGNGTPYGAGKQTASDLLGAAADRLGLRYVDVRLPNLFGEHGRARYNSFVPTFVEAVIDGHTPDIVDRTISLLHVQGAAQTLLDALDPTADARIEPAGVPTSVQEVFDRLAAAYQLYRTGDIPPLTTEFDVDLFNTLRAALFPVHYPIRLSPRSDHRGSLVEVVRAHGGKGQTFVSTTHPGVTRGEHFHLRKIERFVVLSGRARISLRRMYSDDVLQFDVDGDEPCIVDMPTLWAHNITNVGAQDVTTLFWTHELFDPAHPDTFPEPVGKPAGQAG